MENDKNNLSSDNEELKEQDQPGKNNDQPVEKKKEPMDISGTGSNFEESDFVAVPDK